MSKKITPNQLMGEIGEAAVRLRFLTMGFQFDGRSRLEAGVDGIAEVMDNGKPLARMIAVQIKATESSRYASEDESSFTYLVRPDDLEYWRPSNLPVILVLYRKSDDTYFWKQVDARSSEDRRLKFDKTLDVLDANAVDRLAALTVPKAGFGYYVPPLGGGEEALVNILPVTLPAEIFVSSTPHSAKKAAAVLLSGDEPPRFDWVIKGETFWSFSDPRETVCRQLVDLDQVEAVDTAAVAFHEDHDEQNTFAFLLRKAFDHQVRKDLGWNKERKLFYFRALAENAPRIFAYPVMRGTFVELDGKGLLYTNGSIPYYGTYPGMYDPKPLLLCPYKGSDSTIAQIASEVLALTKVNWNSTQMNQKLPIPIRAARAVGEVLKYVSGDRVSSDYARYI